MSNTAPQQFTVHYRTGGIVRFTWRQMLVQGTSAEMQPHAQELARQGFASVIVPVGTVLPELYGHPLSPVTWGIEG